MTYKFWRESIIRILLSQGHVKHEDKVCKNIYRPYFDDGYSPAAAVKEDLGIDAIKYWI